MYRNLSTTLLMHRLSSKLEQNQGTWYSGGDQGKSDERGRWMGELWNNPLFLCWYSICFGRTHDNNTRSIREYTNEGTEYTNSVIGTLYP